MYLTGVPPPYSNTVYTIDFGLFVWEKGSLRHTYIFGGDLFLYSIFCKFAYLTYIDELLFTVYQVDRMLQSFLSRLKNA